MSGFAVVMVMGAHLCEVIAIFEDKKGAVSKQKELTSPLFPVFIYENQDYKIKKMYKRIPEQEALKAS